MQLIDDIMLQRNEAKRDAVTSFLVSASEVTTLWRYTNLFIIIIIINYGTKIFTECTLSGKH